LSEFRYVFQKVVLVSQSRTFNNEKSAQFLRQKIELSFLYCGG